MIPLAVPLIAATARTVGTRMLGNGIKYAGNVIKNNPKISSGLGLAGLYGAISGEPQDPAETQRLKDISMQVANSDKGKLPVQTVGGKQMAYDATTGNYWLGNTPLNTKDGSLQMWLKGGMRDTKVNQAPSPDTKNTTSASEYNKKYEFYGRQIDGKPMTTQDVIDIQKQLGVKADGKWGPKTEAAYKVYEGKINDSKNSAQNAQNAQLPTEGLATTVAPKEVGFWERLFQDDRTPEQRAAEQQAVVDKILGGGSDDLGLAAAQYGR